MRDSYLMIIAAAMNMDSKYGEENGALPEDANVALLNSTTSLEKIPDTLFIKNVPPFIGRLQLMELFQSIPGFKLLMLSDPNPMKRFSRYGWIKFEEGTNIEDIIRRINYTKIKDFEIHLVRHKNQENITHIGHELYSTFERMKQDLSKVVELTKTMDKVRGLECPFPLPDFAAAHFSREDCRKILDKYIIYLRQAHLVCFYCGMAYENDEALLRKCGSIHLRAKQTNISSDNGSDGDNHPDTSEIVPPSWIKYYEHRLDNLIKYQLSDDEIKKYGTYESTSDIEAFYKEKTIQIDTEKFRCSLCSKLFKASEFVHKHFHLKHEEDLQKVTEDVDYFNNYLRDANRPSFLPTFSSQRFGGSSHHFFGNSNTTFRNSGRMMSSNQRYTSVRPDHSSHYPIHELPPPP
jgi:hypothetical protein